MALTRSTNLTKSLLSAALIRRTKMPTSAVRSAGLATATATATESCGGVKDYEDYRRSLYGGDITHKALLVDAVGTLVVPSQPMAQIYKQIGEKYGVDCSEDEILSRYRRAYEQPWDMLTMEGNSGNT
ncbi:hypothetical protein LINGRAHAP2_LOCUS26193 [Linum grandiflorum]